ncbi:hypothetical protein ACFQY4_26640 [Catellatospora bangladeshensis]|uniref:Lipoprotein n=1 Tax=Catellatospora bangladeshensis TaxID=310355 RepID=A0A8J3JJD6_9ACTN|nr:hypothetical protein Cba03nite_72110 [Catellatospora bangladeshensis]
MLGVVAVLTALPAACRSPSDTPAASSAEALAASPPRAAPSVPAATCAEVKDAMVAGPMDPYLAFGDDGAPLTDGMFSGQDGLTLAVQEPCATGDLDGLGKTTAATIMSSVVNTTGRYWAVMLCGKPAERARCVVQFELDDREPVEKVGFADGKLTLVYLTRPSDAGSATLSIRRTAVYALDGGTLNEISRTDEPYKP